MARLFLYSLSGSALINSSGHDLFEVVNLDADGTQLGNVMRSRHILNILEAVRTVEECLNQIQLLCIQIHFLKEILGKVRMVIKLETSDLGDVCLGILPFK